MPFWWARRKRPWYTTRRFRRKRWFPRRRRKTYKRRYRRTFRGRRRRRKTRKVRRKKKKLTIQQWQPQSIVKCKIKGYGCLVAGAEGTQAYCYTNEKYNYPQPKAPGGGGFGLEVFTLQYLYNEWVAHRNIWTKSNDYKELCRFTGSAFTFYRHPTTDFIVQYNIQPPFELHQDTYLSCHPFAMLLSRHHRIILSQQSKPNGKVKKRIKIKPPKQMLTKWFFQQNFATAHLLQIQACACNLNWSYFGPNTQSQLITFRALNTNFYKRHNWAQTLGHNAWLPWLQYPTTDQLQYKYPVRGGTQNFEPSLANYLSSVNYDTGFFSPKVLTAIQVVTKSGKTQHELPITIARYNPLLDTGEGSHVWLVSTIADSAWAKPKDQDLIISGKPLWWALFGFSNYIEKSKQDKGYLQQGLIVVQSKAIQLVTKTDQQYFPILDNSFTQGKMPYDEAFTDTGKKFWYPDFFKQQTIINTFVESGPYIPKYSYLQNSTWNLTYHYSFYFKWGGSEISDHPVSNPKQQGKYDVPDTLTETIQIANPLKQTYQSMLRAWDYRRGTITKRALKRMSEHLEIDSTVQSDDSETSPKKKKITAEIPATQEENKEIQTCLRTLFEENTFQETENLQDLIQQQQQQQQHLKNNILQLLLDLKTKQRAIELQTGLF